MALSNEDALLLCSATVIILAAAEEKRKHRWWMRTLFKTRTGDSPLTELRMEDAAGFRNFTRVSPSDFEMLLNFIGPEIAKQDTNYRKAISVADRLAITLRFLATGDSFQSLMYLFKVSKQSISKIIPAVCTALLAHLQEYIKFPSCKEEWMKISDEFNNVLNFPHCVGAMDGKHIPLQAQMNSGSDFLNCKGHFSIVLLGIIDANYNFIYANVECQDHIADGEVFRNTSVYQKMITDTLNLPDDAPLPGRQELIPYVFVADDAFAMCKNVTKPYSNFQLKGSTERLFNYRMSRARVVVENTFGILSSVFRVFRKPLLISAEKAELVTRTCVYLHNFLRRNAHARSQYTPSGTFDGFDMDTGEVIPGSWRQEAHTALLPLKTVTRRATTKAEAIRLEFAEYFGTDLGRVRWQEKYT